MTYSVSEDSEPIHAYFELTYDTHLVMHRTLLQSMPQAWQSKFVKMLEEYDSAFKHVKKSPMIVQAGERVYLSEATPEQLARGGYERTDYDRELCECTVETECESCQHNSFPRYYDMYGNEFRGDEPVMIPTLTDDPVPHYNRGRTRIEPRLGSAV